jgi:hypothetical protein
MVSSPPTSLFVPHGDGFVATELSRGPWDPASCHGGPVSALLVRACEHAGLAATGGNASDVRWQLARITVELTRPVPVLVPFVVTTELERPGRNVSMIGARFALEDGTEIARARALRIRMADVELAAEYSLEPPFGEAGGGSSSISPAGFAGEQIAFHRDAVEMRFVEGTWLDRGPITMWCRLRCSVVPDETPSGPQRAAAAADFSNGVSAELDAAQMLFINPDLSVHLLRPPEGQWIGMQARSHYGTAGAGLAEAALFDERGRCGRSVQSLFLAPR